jgi:hypothetical protein
MVSRLSGAILAAGRGERLRDAVDGLPKPLVMLGDDARAAGERDGGDGRAAGVWDHQTPKQRD